MKNLKNSNVFITGINGFVGRALSQKLISIGANVFGVSHTKSNAKEILKADILEFERINAFVKRNNIQTIFHLAGESLVEEGQKNPYQTFKINTEGTLNMLEISRLNRVKKIIISSTSHVYGRNKVPYYEGFMPRPSRPYETSKACTDLIAQSYAATFNLPVLIPRVVNIYGPGDLNFTRLIPKTILSVLKNKDPQMWGGQAKREYLFLDDAVSAYLLLATSNEKKIGDNKVFNFGSGDIISVKNLMELILNLSGSKNKIKKISDARDLEISTQFVSAKKAKKILTWEAKKNLHAGLRETIDWYRKFSYNGESTDHL